jgi:hypothetical protein
MRWPTQLQSQLVSAANAADRANRPAIFVALPGVCVVIALVVLLVVLAGFTSARRDVQLQQREWAGLQAMLADLKQRRSATPDLASAFPANAMFDSIIEETAERVWGVGSSELPVTIGQRRSAGFLATKTDLKKTDIECVIQRPVGLDMLTAWFDAVLQVPHLRGVFLSKLELQPVAGGWRGRVVFRRYEYLPESPGS